MLSFLSSFEQFGLKVACLQCSSPAQWAMAGGASSKSSLLGWLAREGQAGGHGNCMGGQLDGWTGAWTAQRPGGGSIRYINVIDYFVRLPLCQSTNQMFDFINFFNVFVAGSRRRFAPCPLHPFVSSCARTTMGKALQRCLSVAATCRRGP